MQPLQRPLPTLPLHSEFPAQLDVQHSSVQTPSPICFRAAIQLSHQGPAQPFVNRGGGGVFNMEGGKGGLFGDPYHEHKRSSTQL